MRQPPKYIGAVTPEGILRHVTDTVKWADLELRNRPEKDSAWGSILLVSPNGSVYSISVTDAGALVSTVILDKP